MAFLVFVLGWLSLSILSFDRFIYLPLIMVLGLLLVGILWKWITSRSKGPDWTQVYPELADNYHPPSPRVSSKQSIDRAMQSETGRMAKEIEEEILRRTK